MWDKLLLIFNTVYQLKSIQIFYQLWYRVKNKLSFGKQFTVNSPIAHPLIFRDGLYNFTSYNSKNTFLFLNRKYTFFERIDWNYNGYSKLWTYNLNYFDFLNQKKMNSDIGLNLIMDYVKNDKIIIDGKEPYPISLRGVNWIKFLSKFQINNLVINRTLYNHYRILSKNIEYHLLGNHILENAFSLLFGAYYFKNDKFYSKSKHIIEKELKEQILNDGGHFELSPMYHQIILYKVLDCIQLIKINKWINDDLLMLLEDSASKMISWLNEVTFENGDIPCVNDSTFNIAPTSEELFNYADQIGVITKKIVLSDSGYRKFRNNMFELFVDVGNVGPLYQPGHVHSDTLSFILHVNNKPVFVDTGVSTYEKNQKRQTERQTSAHNTVVINSEDQTQVWGGFRVAKRAQVKNLKEDVDFIEAEHDGYKRIGVSHLRRFSIDKSLVKIKDNIVNDSNYNQTAYFHLHPSLKNLIINDHSIIIENNITMIFTGTNVIIHKELYEYAEGFNKTKKAIVIKVTFESNLETSIKL
jgi:hypothetical protein